MREIAIHKTISHENIIKFFQVAEDEEHYFVVMELVVGGELFEQVCEQKYFYEKEASPIICQVNLFVRFLYIPC
jgi:calcium-dependent protein kinase